MASTGIGRRGLAAAVFAAALLGAPAQAQQTVPTAPPGFRPQSPQTAAFVDALEDATVAVLPTVIRRVDHMAYSLASQQLIVELINECGMTTATAVDKRVDLGGAPHASQWDLFQGSLEAVASTLEGWPREAEYTLLMEVVMPPGDPRVFGIHTYILDRAGRNAFSFLLNEHHKPFAEADLVAADRTEEAQAALIAEATRVGVAALQAQVEWVEACTDWMAAHPASAVSAGVFEDFEAGLPSTQDPYGNILGFTTFSDGESTVEVETTLDHPPRPGESADNHTLKVDLNVTGWAGFAYVVHDAATKTWRPQDWTEFDGMSFWMYGRDTGTQFYVHVFDNRNPCSTVNDTERFGYTFTDDFSGWQKIVIPFADLVRAEVWNDAPNDGLGLDRVHGWALGGNRTDGPGTWYLDDVALWREGSG